MRKGSHHSPESLVKIRFVNTEPSRILKIKLANSHPCPIEVKAKISATQKGRKRPPRNLIWKQNISVSLSKDQTRQRRSKENKNLAGDKADILVAYRIYDWRKGILKRDNHTCQKCGDKPTGRRLHTHHIKPKETFPELAYELSNGITLCASCHMKEENERRH